MQIRYFGVMRADANKFAYKKCIDAPFDVVHKMFNVYYNRKRLKRSVVRWESKSNNNN